MERSLAPTAWRQVQSSSLRKLNIRRNFFVRFWIVIYCVPLLCRETGMSHLKGIAFQSDETHLEKLRERLRQMPDDELIKFGKQVSALSPPRVGVTPDPWKVQLEEAR